MSTPNVAYVRDELKAILPHYALINDAIAGSIAIKRKGVEYLPMPNPNDNSIDNQNRYNNYRKRAVYYNATGRTLRGFLGQLFLRDPEINIPTTLDVLNADANGEGVSLTQLAKRAATYVLPLGRAGLFTDYPQTNAIVTKADLESQSIQPTISVYSPEKIINWRTKRRGALSVLSLVVLEETYTISDDGFEIKKGTQWRVLFLDESDTYNVSIWRQTESKAFTLFLAPYAPTKADGNTFDEIPFQFIGSENNDCDVDFAPLFDLADLNLSHFRNSADHEENLYVSAQATPVITGLTEAWADRYFKDGIGLGSRAAIPLPEGGDAKLIQAEERSAIFTEMEHKERQMVSLGAKLVEQKQVQRTATEVGIESASENSVLSTIAHNISNAFEKALKWAEFFVGGNSTMVFQVNSDFNFNQMTAQDRAQLIAEWQAEAITWQEMRAGLRRAGSATQEDDEAKEQIETNPPVDNPGADENADDDLNNE